MPKLYLTLKLDSLRGVGEALQEIEDNGLGKKITDVFVEINDDWGEASVTHQ